MSLMSTKKIWVSSDGIQIEYITYRTILVDRIRNAIVSRGEQITDEQSTFILCAATTTDVILSENPPLWAQTLHAMMKGGEWLKNPTRDYESIGYAPSEMMDRWFEGYQATRDSTHAAPPELQQPAPLKPGDDESEDDSGGETKDNSNPTGHVVPSSSSSSSTGSGKRSAGKTRTAT